MTHSMLRALVNNSLRTNPDDRSSLDDAKHASQFLQPTDVRLSGPGGWKGDPAFLVDLAKKNPKRLPQLIGSRSIHHSMVDTLLGVDHRPTAQIADRVAAHQELTRTGIDYVLAHGTYRALARLIDSHFPSLDSADLKVASARAAKTSGRLLPIDLPLVGEWPGYHHFPTPLHRDFLAFQLEALSALPTSAVDIDAAKLLVNSAAQAGLALTAAHKKHWTLPVDLSSHGGRRAWAIREPDQIAKSMIVLHPNFGKMLRALPIEDQADVVKNYPQWCVVEQTSDAKEMLQQYPGMWTKPGEVLSEYLLRSMPLDMIKNTEEHAAPALRLVRKHMGDDANSWADFAGLADTWNGTLGDLLDTLGAI